MHVLGMGVAEDVAVPLLSDVVLEVGTKVWLEFAEVGTGETVMVTAVVMRVRLAVAVDVITTVVVITDEHG